MIRLLFAELSLALGYLAFRSSEAAAIVNPDYFLVTLILPIVLYVRNSNPYPLWVFALAVAMTLPHYLPSSELFKSFLDFMFFLTGDEKFRVLQLTLHARSPEVAFIFAISSLYVSSEVYSSAIIKRKIYGEFPAAPLSAITLLISSSIFIVYRGIPKVDNAFVLGVMGVAMLILYAVMRR